MCVNIKMYKISEVKYVLLYLNEWNDSFIQTEILYLYPRKM